MSRLLALLRSRRLAIWLLLACVAWAVAGSAVPQLSRDGASSVAEWRVDHPVLAVPVGALGLHAAWTAPVFLAAMTLLAVSTGACAFERTRWAWRAIRAGSQLTESRRAVLRENPALSVETGDLGIGASLEAAEAVLRRWGYRVETSGGDALAAMKGRHGPLGSPVFHWSLTALFVVVALGTLTRSEGLMGVPVGGQLPNRAEEYGRLERGPLYSDRYAGLVIAVTEMASGQVRDGVTIGSIPRVRLLAGETVVAEQDVYANSPLRYGSLMVHLNGEGLVAFVGMTAPDGTVLPVRRAYFDVDPSRSSGFSQAKFTYTGTNGRMDVVLEPSPRASDDEAPKVAVAFTGPSGESTSVVVPVDTPVDTAAGTLVVRDPGVYARLSVVDDASVYPIYTLFAVGLAGLGVAIMMPRRRLWVLAHASAEGDVVLHVMSDSWTSDGALLVELEDELRAEIGRPGSMKE